MRITYSGFITFNPGDDVDHSNGEAQLCLHQSDVRRLFETQHGSQIRYVSVSVRACLMIDVRIRYRSTFKHTPFLLEIKAEAIEFLQNRFPCCKTAYVQFPLVAPVISGELLHAQPGLGLGRLMTSDSEFRFLVRNYNIVCAIDSFIVLAWCMYRYAVYVSSFVCVYVVRASYATQKCLRIQT